jgi:hypothetical protein
MLFAPAAAFAAQKASPSHDPRFGEIPYEAFTVRDSFHREILFFVTPQPNGRRKVPLIVSLLGSGADSNFLRRGDRVLDGHRVLREVF